MAVSGLLNRPVIHTPDDRAIPFYATMHHHHPNLSEI